MADVKDHAGIDWLRDELERVLGESRNALQSFVDGQQSAIEVCKTCLHQVQGSLKMLELKPAADLAAEMEAVALALADQSLPARGTGSETLMQAILEMLSSVLPSDGRGGNVHGLIGELRRVRGLSSEPQEPNFSLVQTPPSDVAIARFLETDGQSIARRVRGAYQTCLVSVLRNEDATRTAVRMLRIVLALQRLSRGTAFERLWWLFGAYLEAAHHVQGTLQRRGRHILRQVDQELRQLATLGVDALKRPVPLEFVKALLEEIQQLGVRSARTDEVLTAFGVAHSHEQAVLAGKEAVAVVAKEVLKELVSVKERLDIYVRSELRNIDSLGQLRPDLLHLAKTLSVAGLGAIESVVLEEHARIDLAVSQGRMSEPELMGIAEALVQVDEELRLLSGENQDSNSSAQAVHAVVREARVGLEEVKRAITDFIGSKWDHSLIESVPAILGSVRGGLLMVELDRAAHLVGECRAYVSDELLARRIVPEWQNLDRLADAITSVDYYLERFLETRGKSADSVLDLAAESIDALLGRLPDDDGRLPGDDAYLLTRGPQPDYFVETEPANGVPDAAEVAATQSPTPAARASRGEAGGSPETLQEDVPSIGNDQPLPHEQALDSILEEFETLSEELAGDEALAYVEPEVADSSAALAASAPVLDDAPVAGTSVGDASNIERSVVDESSGSALSADVASDDAPFDDAPFDGALSEVAAPDDASISATPFSATPLATLPSDAPAATFDDLPIETPIDEDVLEVFLEEFEELAQKLNEQLPKWHASLHDKSALQEIRRAFHTLKGSSRMVGANALGDIGWAMENMLNRVLDGAAGTTRAQHQLVTDACAMIRPLREAFANRTAPKVRLKELLSRAHRLAAHGSADDDTEVLAPLPQYTQPQHAEPQYAEPQYAEPQYAEPQHEELSQAAPADEQAIDVVFRAEASSHLRNFAEALAQASVGDRISAQLTRAAHTLRGSAAAVGAIGLMELAECTEHWLSRLQNWDEPTLDLAHQVNRALRVEGERAPEAHSLLAEHQALAQRMRDGDQAREEQADQQLASQLQGWSYALTADQVLRQLGSGDEDVSEQLDQIRGELAGAATTLDAPELAPLAELVHAMVGVYDVVDARDPVAPYVVDTLRAGHRRLLQMLDELAMGGITARAPEVPQLRQLEDQLIEAMSLEPEQMTAPPAHVHAPAFEDDGADADVTDERNDLRAAPDIEPELQEKELTAAADAFADEILETVLETAADADPVPRVTVANDVVSPLLEESLDDIDLQAIEAPAASSSKSGPAQPEGLQLPADLDVDLLQVFAEEAVELLESFEQAIEAWRANAGNFLYLEHLLRALHTLKGGARLSGLAQMGDEVHALESYLQSVGTDSTLGPSFFAELVAHHDHLERWLPAMREHVLGEPADASTSHASQPGAAPSDSARAHADEADEEQRTSRVVSDAPAARRQQQDMVRVSATVLEELVDLAGESAISRARVNEVITDIAQVMVEMNTTVARVREQVRRLEMETDAQVLYRRERVDAPAHSEFDPLELDRYSQLQQLARGLTESASDLLDLQETVRARVREADTMLTQQARLHTELQQQLMRTRMVPFTRLVPRLRRIVRQVARELDKEVDLSVSAADGELDRSVLERMVPPIEHMLRNAVDHGIEAVAQRLKKGKDRAGRIEISLSREANDIVIAIRDDGAGIDTQAVRRKAVKDGLIAADAELKESEVLDLIFTSGFSMARSVTQISGRGVGMDVVAAEVQQLGGNIEVKSTVGRGTSFTLRLPFTVSVNRALMVMVGEDAFAVPLNSIEGIVRAAPDELGAKYSEDEPAFSYAGMDYRLAYLGSLLGRQHMLRNDVISLPVLLARSGDEAMAVHVDAVQGSREIVVKSLGPQFAGVAGVSGATLLGDGSVVVILDLPGLVRRFANARTDRRVMPEGKEKRGLCVMVVDDSVTVRKVTSRLLERQGMEVVLAKDGVEAVAQLQDRQPDVMLLDIEMPRMDGFEVAQQVRRDERMSDLPIIMISSRSGVKHRERAKELGVDRFLGKPFQEGELLTTIQELVGVQSW